MNRVKWGLTGIAFLFVIAMVAVSWSPVYASSLVVTGTGLDPNSSYTCDSASVNSNGDLMITYSVASQSTGTISGTVDPGGALVFLYADNTSLLNAGTARYTISSPISGRYTFTNVPYGDYYIIPVMPGLSFKAGQVNLSASGINPLGGQSGSPTSFAAESTVCSQPVNGACGSSNGGSFQTAPTSGLCSLGTPSPSSLNGSGPWAWQCIGANSGTTANCSANPLTPVNGACGSSNGGTFQTAPVSGLCSAGTASPSTLSGSGPWSWQCIGANSGTTANCSASQGSLNGEVTVSANITFGGAQVQQTIPANQTRYFTCTIPSSGKTTSYMSVSSISQNGDLDVFIVQGGTVLTPSAASNYYSDFTAIYNKYGWGGALNVPYPGIAGNIPQGSPNAWAQMSTSIGGEAVYLNQGATVTTNTTTYLPGKYYIVVKNKGTINTNVYLKWQ